MLRYIKTAIISLMIAITGLALVSPIALATPKDEICNGVAVAGGGNGCANPAGTKTVEDVVKLVVNVLSWVVGIVAVIMIIIGGLKYITSGGDANSTASAKNTILYAIIGLIIVALAQVIVRFVLNKV